MKNFKRVISAVIALALSASTLVAVSASKFTDVDDTNVNAEAINVLAALDVVSGYEDGSFNPEGDITRAEAARMIVSALNMNDDAAAAAGTSKFTDVNEQAAWAAGFINVGVAQGYINGIDDTTFAPQDKVTYAQMCTMLTIILGYKKYAEANGGYPKGFIEMAASGGVNKGVSLAAETPLKRGQVARMVYNTVTAPILGITEYKTSGDTYEQLDGVTNPKKTLLSDKFDAVEVKATVTAFPAAGQVTLALDDANRYNTSANWGNYNFVGITVDNDIDLSNYLQQQVKAILKLDSNNKTHLVYVEGTSAVETVEIAADSYVKTDYAANNQIKYGSTKYTFAAGGIDIYVNGELYAPAVAADVTIDSILSKAVGTAKLAKTAGTKNYDAIFVDLYHIGQVTNVDYKNGTTTVKFSTTAADNLAGYKKIEVSDNDLETDAVKLVVKADGQNIELKDLNENDVIAVKTEFSPVGQTISQGAGHKNITVLVSRDTISGKVNSVETNGDDNAFVVGSETYAAVNKATIGLKVGESYNTIYLDAFGRVYSFDDEAVEDTKNYAILAKVSDKTDVILVLPDGTKKSYEVKDTTVWGTAEAAFTATEVSNGPIATVDTDADTVLEDIVVVGAPEDSVVEYTLKKGQINSITPVGGVVIPANTEYKASVSKLATVGISDATGIINVQGASTYKDYSAMGINNLADGEKYKGAGFGKIGTTNNYSLVILTKAGYDYGANSRFAVVNAAGFSTGVDEDGDNVEQLKVLVNGEKTTLNFTAAAKAAYLATSPVNYGDAFFYVLDSDGLVKSISKITRAAIAAPGAIGLGVLGTAGADYDGTKWGNTLTGNEDIKLVRGILVGASTNAVRIIDTPAAGANQAIDVDAFESFALANDCIIYTYDTDADIDNDKDRLDEEGTLQVSNFKNWRVTEVGTVAPFNTSAALGKIVWNITWSGTPVSGDLTSRGIAAKLFDTLEGTTAADEAQYVLALIVDDQVVEIYEVIQ